jgi:hypothetical protein
MGPLAAAVPQRYSFTPSQQKKIYLTGTRCASIWYVLLIHPNMINLFQGLPSIYIKLVHSKGSNPSTLEYRFNVSLGHNEVEH